MITPIIYNCDPDGHSFGRLGWLAGARLGQGVCGSEMRWQSEGHTERMHVDWQATVEALQSEREANGTKVYTISALSTTENDSDYHDWILKTITVLLAVAAISDSCP